MQRLAQVESRVRRTAAPRYGNLEKERVVDRLFSRVWWSITKIYNGVENGIRGLR